MNATFTIKILIVTLFVAVVLSLFIEISSNQITTGSATKPLQEKIKPLPEDVENVMKEYSFQETNGDLQITISGKQIVRRGKKILGLRSNLVKTNFFQEIRGTVKTPKGIMQFSASDAEWDADTAHPLILTKNIEVTLHDKAYDHVKNARIYFRNSLIEIDADRKKFYYF